MLKKDYKLGTKELKDLFNKENKSKPLNIFRGDLFDIKSYKNIVFKGAVILSSKNFKSSVKRNKIKRRIYSILEKYKKENKINNFILIYPKKNIENIEFQNLEKEVYNILHKINTK